MKLARIFKRNMYVLTLYVIDKWRSGNNLVQEEHHLTFPFRSKREVNKFIEKYRYRERNKINDGNDFHVIPDYFPFAIVSLIKLPYNEIIFDDMNDELFNINKRSYVKD